MGSIKWIKDRIQAEHPFYAEMAGVRIYDLEELNYYLQKFFYLMDQEFFSDKLITFLAEEVHREDLAKMVQMSRGKSNPVIIASKLIVMIGGMGEQEQQKWRDKAATFQRMPVNSQLMLKAETLYGLKQYAKAESFYREIVEANKNDVSEGANEEIGKACYRLAYISLESLSWKAAGSYLQEAYGLLGYEAILKELFFLTCMSAEVICDDSLFQNISLRSRRDWEQEYTRMKEEEAQKLPLSHYEGLLENVNPATGESTADQLLTKWQQEYRKIRKNSCQETDFSV